MKFTFALLLAFTTLFIVACGNKATDNKEGEADKATVTANTAKDEASKLLVKKWQIDGQALDAMMKAEMDKQLGELQKELEAAKTAKDNAKVKEIESSITMANTMAKEMAGPMLEAMKSVTFDFKADGSVVMTNPDGNETAKWELSEDGKSISTTNEKGEKSTMKISELTATKLVIKDEEMTLTFKPA